MNIPMTSLRSQYCEIKEEIDAAIRQVIQDCKFVHGTQVQVFEGEIAAYCGTGYASGVASGTDALHLALLACDIGSGDEVITPSFTFIATAETIVRCGAIPVFIDISPGTCNLDIGKIEEKITSRTRAILPVHLYGQAVDMDPVMELARRYNLKVIEDCAQALGTEYRGRKVGSIGDAGCLSFFPSKNLGAYGDGGMIVTSSREIAERVNLLRNHGARHSYDYETPGFNSRLDTMQAAILSVKLRHLDGWIQRRRENAELYGKLLKGLDGVSPLHVEEFGRHSFNYYTVRLDSALDRDELRKHLESRGISTMVYYPLSLHLQDAFRHLGYHMGDLPESELAQEQVLSLPMYPELSRPDIHRIVSNIKEFISASRAVYALPG
jgi:dTDP-4-amino-4,6-dideoxygalactose transaminase